VKISRRKALWIIVAVVAVLVVVVVLAAGKTIYGIVADVPTKGYRPDDEPGGVAFNYQTALIREDYHRAYGYLSPTLDGYPDTFNVFVEQLEEHGSLPDLQQSPCVYLEDVNTAGSSSRVKLVEQQFDPCTPLVGAYKQNLMWSLINVELRLEKEGWRIVGSDEHFAGCWAREAGCE
jgi:hypothetical protein